MHQPDPAPPAPQPPHERGIEIPLSQFLRMYGVLPNSDGSSKPRLCQHIMPSGRRCRSPRVRRQRYCYFHGRWRARHDVHIRAPRPRTLPLVEDRASLQIAINDIMQALIDDGLTARQAGVLLYGMQISLQNFRKDDEHLLAPAEKQANSPVDPQTSTEEWPTAELSVWEQSQLKEEEEAGTEAALAAQRAEDALLIKDILQLKESILSHPPALNAPAEE